MDSSIGLVDCSVDWNWLMVGDLVTFASLVGPVDFADLVAVME